MCTYLPILNATHVETMNEVHVLATAWLIGSRSSSKGTQNAHGIPGTFLNAASALQSVLQRSRRLQVLRVRLCLRRNKTLHTSS